MEKEFFLNGGIHNPSLQFEHPFSWHTMEIQTSQSPDCFLSTPPPNDQFESALSSMVSSPAASNSPLSNDNFMIRELIGKLGSICNSGDITNNSCYSTPLSSPPKMGIPMPNMDHLVKENLPILGNLPAMLGDPGFAERAARFSSFGSRSFNGRTTQFGMNNSTKNSNNGNGEMGYPSNFSNLGGNGKLQRVSSSPSLKEIGSQGENNNNNKKNLLLSNIDRKHGGNFGQECNNSRENSSISGQNLGGENGSNRKRKAPANKGKSKELQSQPHLPSSSNKMAENGEDSSAKRSKSDESGETKREENRGDDGKKQSNGNQKPPEPPKDYIHVRARRGQATDSHSLAERVRREKISERMKLLQDLVPGCDKVTGKALMLDEIINYVQSLQRQVEFLSMKLASVNPRLDFNMGNLFSKDVIQPNCSLTHPMYPIDSLAQNLYGQPHQNPLQDSIPTTAPSPMQPHQIHALHLPSIDPFSTPLPQLPSLCEGDLQSIVQMGYGLKENGFQSQSLHGSNPSPLMKIEF